MKDWQHLQTLLAFAENKTLARAAEKLDIDRSTVSRRIEALEQELKVKLVERMGRDLVLTEAGREAVLAAEAIRAETLSLTREIGGRDDAVEGVVRFTTTSKLAEVLGDALASFSAEHPNVVLEVNTTNTAVDLSLMEADVALRLTNAPPDNLVGRPLAAPASALYASESMANRLTSETIVPLIGWGFDDSVLAWLQGELSLQARKVMSSNDMNFVKAMVSSGRGVAFIPCYCVAVGDGLVQVTKPFESGMPKLWLLYRNASKPVARIRRLVAHLAQAVEDLGAVFGGGDPAPGALNPTRGPGLVRGG